MNSQREKHCDYQKKEGHMLGWPEYICPFLDSFKPRMHTRLFMTVPASALTLVTVETDVPRSTGAAAVGPAGEEEEGSARGIHCGGVFVRTTRCVPDWGDIVPLSAIIGPGSVPLKGPAVAMETEDPASSRPFLNKPGQRRETRNSNSWRTEDIYTHTHTHTSVVEKGSFRWLKYSSH